MEEAKDDELAITVLEDVRVANLAAVELPLAVKPTDSGKDAALALVGGIEELSKVTADEERALKLHMRPKDPLCRPLVARRNESNTASFVFKATVSTELSTSQPIILSTSTKRFGSISGG